MNELKFESGQGFKKHKSASYDEINHRNRSMFWKHTLTNAYMFIYNLGKPTQSSEKKGAKFYWKSKNRNSAQ